MAKGKIDKIINKHRGDAAALIQVLLEIQQEDHWLTRDVLEKVSEKLGVSLGDVEHAVTFYKALSAIPEGRHTVHVCNGTSCHVRGASRILTAVEDVTGIKPGETSPDMKFSLEAVTCLGHCSSGPSIVVDGEHLHGIDPASVQDVLKGCK